MLRNYYHLDRFYRSALWLTLMAMVLIFTTDPLFSETIEQRQAKKDHISKGIKKYKINIGRLQEGIKEQEEQIRQTRKVELTLLTELQDIDTRLVEQNHKLAALDARMQQQKEFVAAKKAEGEQAAIFLRGTQEHVQKRMQAFYKIGRLGLINITFSNQTLPELLRFQDSFLALIKYDQQVIDTYRRTIEELGQAVESLNLQESIFKEIIAENKLEQEKLDQIKEEKERLLTRIRTQTKLHEQAVSEMESATENLTSTLIGLEDQGKKLEQSFLYNKGKHPPPVKGKVITRFNQNSTNLLGITSVSKGIAIDAPSGSTVKAIHEGKVHYSGYLRGYGNTVIVNHGHQYYSITSRLERLLVEKDKRVTEQTPIGLMGDTATLLTPGLYFELRKDTDQLDPLKWLDVSALVLSP